MCFGSTTTPTPSFTGSNTNSSTSYAPWASTAAQNQVGTAQNLVNSNPAQAYSGPSEASFGPQFGQASTYLSGQLGQTNPYTTAAGGSLQNLIGSINPNAGVQSYMSPYIQSALQPTLQNLNLQLGQQQQQTAANATQAGSYGGTAQGVQSALNNKFGNDAVTNATGTAYNNAYTSALQNMLGNNNLLNSASTNLGQIGQQSFGQGTTLASMLAGLGSTQQQAGQTGINTAMTQANQQAMLPVQQQSGLASIIASLGPLGGSNGTSSTVGYNQGGASPNYSGYSMLGGLLGSLI